MRGQRTLRIGLVLAASAVGVLSAACFPPAPTGPASLTVTPSPANFPSSSQAQSFPMPQVKVTITNTGGHTAMNVVVHPVNVYSVPSSTCSSLAPGQSCTAMIQFCPNAQGQYNFPLTVTGQDGTANLSATTMLIGTATA